MLIFHFSKAFFLVQQSFPNKGSACSLRAHISFPPHPPRSCFTHCALARTSCSGLWHPPLHADSRFSATTQAVSPAWHSLSPCLCFDTSIISFNIQDKSHHLQEASFRSTANYLSSLLPQLWPLSDFFFSISPLSFLITFSYIPTSWNSAGTQQVFKKIHFELNSSSLIIHLMCLIVVTSNQNFFLIKVVSGDK